MLERTDRLALAVADATAAAEDFASIFDTQITDVALDAETVSTRTTLQWGQDQVELLEPTGDGPVANFLSSGRSGIFAGGFSLSDPEVLAQHLEGNGVRVRQQGDGRYLILPEDLHGTGVILSKRESRDRVGLNDKIWQITYAVAELGDAVTRYTDLFGLEDCYTNIYTSDHFGYEGAITWFEARDGGLLDSLEYLEPNDPGKAVARFLRRNESGIYMASIESNDIPAIRERVIGNGSEDGSGWQGAEFGGFIHPKRLHGLLLGLVSYENWNANRPLP